MSRQVRHRVTAVLLCGLLFGAPLLTNAVANAGQPGPAPGSSTPAPITAIEEPRTNIKRATRIKTRTSSGTGSSAPMHAGKSPRTQKAGVRRVPSLDLSSPADSAPATPARPGADIAVERVTGESLSENGLIGLLAAVSMVLVLGVSSALIRAIVSERASRTKIA